LIRVLFPSPLYSYTHGRSEDRCEGASLAELLDALDSRYPGIRFRMIDEQDRIRPHIRFFVNGAMVRELSHSLAPSDEVMIVASLSGG
jgi:molybdopterin synthase sulfur carrier subunit